MRFSLGTAYRGLVTRSLLSVLASTAITLAEPTNGDLEAGNFSGPWTTGAGHDGGIEIISGSDSTDEFVDAISGDHSALVHNGPGADAEGLVGVLRSPTFTVTQYGGTLSFNWDFLTFEFTGDYWEYLDSYLIELVSVYGATTLESGDVSRTDFLLFDDFQIAPEANIGFYEHLGVQNRTYTFAEELGRADLAYWLRFTVRDGEYWDGPDDWTAYGDSALLIDDVVFRANQPPPPATPIPEPSTLALIALGGLAAVVARRRRR